MTHYRKGDIVHVLAEVRSDFDSAVETHVQIAVANPMPHSDDWLSVRPDVLTLVTRKFAVGDTVCIFNIDGKDTGSRGSIIAIHGDWLWVMDGDEAISVEAKYCQAYDAPPPQIDGPEKIVNGIRTTPKLFGIVPSDPDGATEITYTTAQGDTLAAMAYVFQTSVDTIKTMNPDRLMGMPHDAPLVAGLALQVNDNRLPF